MCVCVCVCVLVMCLCLCLCLSLSRSAESAARALMSACTCSTLFRCVCVRALALFAFCLLRVVKKVALFVCSCSCCIICLRHVVNTKSLRCRWYMHDLHYLRALLRSAFLLHHSRLTASCLLPFLTSARADWPLGEILYSGALFRLH